jgi:hypothetical protein
MLFLIHLTAGVRDALKYIHINKTHRFQSSVCLLRYLSKPDQVGSRPTFIMTELVKNS